MNKYEVALKKESLEWSIAYHKKRLQEIVVCSDTDLSTKRMLADINIVLLLQDVVPLLSKGRQQEMQACLDLREQVWHPSQTTHTDTQTDGSFSTLQAE